MPHPQHRRLAATLTLALLLPLGLAIRFAHLGLPYFLVKYAASALWAAGIYALLAALAPRLTPLRLALTAFAGSVAVELFKLVRAPALDAFRLTLAGKVLLGRHFAFADIVAYAAAIALCFFFDTLASRRAARRNAERNSRANVLISS